MIAEEELFALPNNNAKLIVKICIVVAAGMLVLTPYIPGIFVDIPPRKGFYKNHEPTILNDLGFDQIKVDFSVPSWTNNMTEKFTYDLRVYYSKDGYGICCQEVSNVNATYSCKSFSLVGYYYNILEECKDRIDFFSQGDWQINFLFDDKEKLPKEISIQENQPLELIESVEMTFLNTLNYAIVNLTVVIITLIIYDNFYLGDSLESTPFFSLAGMLSQMLVLTYYLKFSDTIIAMITLMQTSFLIIYTIALLEFFYNLIRTWHAKISIILFVCTEIYIYLVYATEVKDEEAQNYILLYILTSWLQFLFCFIDFFHLSAAYRFISLFVLNLYANLIYLILLGQKDGFGICLADEIAVFANAVIIAIILVGILILINDLGNETVEFVRVLEFNDHIDIELLRHNLLSLRDLFSFKADNGMRRNLSNDLLYSLNSNELHENLMDYLGQDQIDSQSELEVLCSICLSPLKLDGSTVHKTNCNHMFHKECLRNWRITQRTCPICRRNMNGR